MIGEKDWTAPSAQWPGVVEDVKIEVSLTRREQFRNREVEVQCSRTVSGVLLPALALSYRYIWAQKHSANLPTLVSCKT